MEETAADNKCLLANDAHEAQQPEENEEKGKTKTTSESVADKDKELPELTIVLLGDTNSMEIGPNNILLDHEEKSNVDQFSSKLYDMCGRQISVINMIGLQNVAKIPSDQAFHVFLLLVPYGLHCSHYSSGIQWLEKTFGEGFLPYVMTVVTREPGEKCESALADLKANSGLTKKRFHTCTRNMTDEDEIIALLEKIDIMVSENNPHCYSGLMCDEDKDEDHLQPNKKEDEIRSSGYQHKQKELASALRQSASAVGRSASAVGQSASACWTVGRCFWTVGRCSWAFGRCGWKVGRCGWTVGRCFWTVSRCGRAMNCCLWLATRCCWVVSHCGWAFSRCFWNFRHWFWAVSRCYWKVIRGCWKFIRWCWMVRRHCWDCMPLL
ncbi:uncharacterized protein LOC101487113 [Maylandia zebra]|uniref:uncharacterized protein LOC101487113 n=1 Tax=Maylandia zebra TaxID=106582 RepID=UPI0006CECEC8|nr:GTPase IMAP family member 8-like [Maylandia zebra]